MLKFRRYVVCISVLQLLCSRLSYSQNTDCGTERWLIKVLKDQDTASINFQPKQSSITQQTKLPKVTTIASDTRLTSEKNVYTVPALITQYKLETDGDVHLVIHDPDTDSSMIAEIPNPDCPTLQGTSHVEQYRMARQWINDSIGTPKTSFVSLSPPKLVVLTGVGYYDPYHGQTGVASNNRELHPILGISSDVQQDVSEQAQPELIFCLYPNPARNAMNVYAAIPDKTDEKIIGFEVIALDGNEIYHIAYDTKIAENKINIYGIGSGVYCARLITNKREIDRKFVVSK